MESNPMLEELGRIKDEEIAPGSLPDLSLRIRHSFMQRSFGFDPAACDPDFETLRQLLP